MEWISIKQKPKPFEDVLLTDEERIWVGHRVDHLHGDVYFLSHPDFGREPKNEYGAPASTYSKPTLWMPLPK